MNDLNVLYGHCYAIAKNELRKFGCDSSHFDDIYQDAFYIITERNIFPGTSVRNPRSYIVQICKILWFKERKRQKSQIQVEEIEDHSEGEPENVEIMSQLLSKYFEKLSSTCREILTLYSLNYTEEKISRILKLDGPKTANNKKLYCKDRLRKMIKKDPLFDKLNE